MLSPDQGTQLFKSQSNGPGSFHSGTNLPAPTKFMTSSDVRKDEKSSKISILQQPNRGSSNQLPKCINSTEQLTKNVFISDSLIGSDKVQAKFSMPPRPRASTHKPEA